MTGTDGARAEYALRIELEAFSQVFDSSSQSRVVVRMRATVVHVPTQGLRAQRTFVAERPATPNAEGASSALGVAADALIEELLPWVAQNLGAGAR